MNKDDALRIKRFEELSERAYARGRAEFTEFLNLSEQDLIKRTNLSTPYVLTGAYDGAERKIAAFADFAQPPPIICLKIEPLAQKFAEALTHRDFLGALLGLGIRREVLGDIIVHENCAWLFCLESIAAYIIEQFKKVKHTPVKCALSSVPDAFSASGSNVQIVVASERLDALIAAVFKLSRSESRELVEGEKVFINSRLTASASTLPDVGDIVSVRGFGRFRYDGIEQETRKGRLRVSVCKYQKDI